MSYFGETEEAAHDCPDELDEIVLQSIPTRLRVLALADWLLASLLIAEFVQIRDRHPRELGNLDTPRSTQTSDGRSKICGLVMRMQGQEVSELPVDDLPLVTRNYASGDAPI